MTISGYRTDNDGLYCTFYGEVALNDQENFFLEISEKSDDIVYDKKQSRTMLKQYTDNIKSLNKPLKIIYINLVMLVALKCSFQINAFFFIFLKYCGRQNVIVLLQCISNIALHQKEYIVLLEKKNLHYEHVQKIDLNKYCSQI